MRVSFRSGSSRQPFTARCRLLSKANVAVVPGAAFGDNRLVRLSYATSIYIIKKGLDRFQDFCRTL
jgi:aspartate aminotransferase